MVDREVVDSVKRYLAETPNVGVHARRAVVFGSFARGNPHEWSDIDLVVIAPEFDGRKQRKLITELWKLAADTDVRIEPIACGEREWETDDGRPILEIARKEGVMIELDEAEAAV